MLVFCSLFSNYFSKHRLVDPVVNLNAKYYASQDIHSIDWNKLREGNPSINSAIAYSPTNKVLDNLISDAISVLNSTVPLRVDSNTTATDAQRHLITNNIFVGVEFPDEWRNITSLPTKLEFSLRFPYEPRIRGEKLADPTEVSSWFTNKLFRAQRIDIALEDGKERNDSNTIPDYLREGFIPVQAAISRAYIQGMMKGKERIIPDVFLQCFPDPPNSSDSLLTALGSFIPMIILLSLMYPAINIVKYITMEKEKQLKEAMKIMGLSNWLQ